jgi:alkanesulfonate monooxygenase
MARLRFHWSMSSAGDPYRATRARSDVSGIPDIDAHIQFCRVAEQCGLEYLLTACGFHRPDAMVLAAALGMVTEKIKFLVAVRSGLFGPTLFAQQVNTVSALTGGRIAINRVNGHSDSEQRYYGDFLGRDQRYARSDEFLDICRALWAGRDAVTYHGQYFRVEEAVLNTPFAAKGQRGPELYIGGASPLAVQQACKYDACLLTTPAAPEDLQARLAPLRARGGRAGLIVALIARPTRADAIAAAEQLLQRAGGSARVVHRSFRARSESTAFASTFDQSLAREWLTPTLWTGAVAVMGPAATALVGSYDDIAAAMLAYKQAGIGEFLLLGWPDIDEMMRFASDVAPRVRAQESESC